MDAIDFANARNAKLAEALGEEAPEVIEKAPAVDIPPDTIGSDPEETPAQEEVSEDAEVDAPAPPDPEDAVPTDTEEDAREAAAEALGEDASEEEKEAAREQASEEFYVGRYRSKAEAETALAEKKDRYLKELEQDRAELQRKVAEVETQQAQPQIDQEEWVAWAESSVEAGAGSQGALSALQTGGWKGYQIYREAWQGSEDPQVRQQANAFNDQLLLEVSHQRAQAEAQAAAPAGVTTAEADEAKAIVMASRSDYEQWEERMSETLDVLPPEYRMGLRQMAETGGVQGKAAALERLYLETRVRFTDPEVNASAERAEKERRVQSTQAAKVAATVSSSEGTPSHTPLNAAESQALEIKNARRKAWGLPLLEE